MRKVVKWLDPKLEKYRGPKEKFTPKDTRELIELLKRTPKEVLSSQEKNMFAAMMSLRERRVAEIMLPKDEMTFVEEDEILGPLTLDRLYQSGFSHFPVVDKRGKIKGAIDTDALNSLQVKESVKAKDCLGEGKIVFLNEKTTLWEVIDEFLRTNNLFFVVTNESEEMIGVVTFEMVIYYLLGGV